MPIAYLTELFGFDDESSCWEKLESIGYVHSENDSKAIDCSNSIKNIKKVRATKKGTEDQNTTTAFPNSFVIKRAWLCVIGFVLLWNMRNGTKMGCEMRFSTRKWQCWQEFVKSRRCDKKFLWKYANWRKTTRKSGKGYFHLLNKEITCEKEKLVAIFDVDFLWVLWQNNMLWNMISKQHDINKTLKEMCVSCWNGWELQTTQHKLLL